MMSTTFAFIGSVSTTIYTSRMAHWGTCFYKTYM
jgi:hypothetical protein